MTGLYLGREVQEPGTGYEAAVVSLPRKRMYAVLDGKRHEVMPRGMEFELVDAMSVRIMGMQFGRKSVGVVAPSVRLSRTDAFPVGGQTFDVLSRSVALHQAGKNRIDREEIDVPKRWGLVHNVVRHTLKNMRTIDQRGR
jgi:hypothetical protein